MTDVSTDSGSSESPNELSASNRAAIFAAANARDSRGSAFHRDRTYSPVKAWTWAIGLVIILGVGGIAGDHFFPVAGQTNASVTKPTLNITTTPSLQPANSLSSLEAFMGVKFIDSARATDFTLLTPSGHHWSLAAQRGKVVVLTFFDETCNDMCPVLGAEIKQAALQLGPNSRVVFVVVNSDPRHTRASRHVAALRVPAITDVTSVRFLTGSLYQLDRVWSAYGILIKLGTKEYQVSHNNAFYFIAPDGDIAAYSVPFARESALGQYTLDAPTLHRYAEAIAATAKSLFR